MIASCCLQPFSYWGRHSIQIQELYTPITSSMTPPVNLGVCIFGLHHLRRTFCICCRLEGQASFSIEPSAKIHPEQRVILCVNDIRWIQCSISRHNHSESMRSVCNTMVRELLRLREMTQTSRNGPAARRELFHPKSQLYRECFHICSHLRFRTLNRI